MQCRKTQELLKADYLDGEINQREEKQIKEHLAKCPECRRLEKELQVQHMLFQKTKQPQVPERVWQNIRDAIVTERLNKESSVSSSILQRLRESILAPRPVFAIAGVLTAIIFVVIFAGAIIQKKQSFSKENSGESVVGYNLNDENEDLLYTLGTNIEEYFL